MPAPSGGCQTCKIRRIKCDETKPICQRCTKSRRICLETSDAKAACFTINVENAFASGELKRPRGPRSSLSLVRPRLDLPTRALAYFLKYHLQLSGDRPLFAEGLPECVASWKASGWTSPMVDLALSSMALATYSRTQRHQPAMVEASSRHCRLLEIIQDQIRHIGVSQPQQRDIDACLLAILLMGRFEGVMHYLEKGESKGSFSSLRSWSHHDGAMAVLRAWYDGPDLTGPSSIVKQSRRGLVKSCLLRQLLLPDWILDGSRFGENGVELEFDRVMVNLANLRYKSASLRQSNDVGAIKVISHEMTELDRQLQSWMSLIQTNSAYQQHNVDGFGWPKLHFYSSKVYTYLQIGHAAVWCQYFSTSMLINSTHLKFLRQHPECFSTCVASQLDSECLGQLQDMANSLAATIPYVLECCEMQTDETTNQSSLKITPEKDVKPYLANTIVWPLSIASSLDTIDNEQQQWFKSEIASIGRTTGDSILECAETERWAVL